MKKRFLGIFLTLAMVLSFVPVTGVSALGGASGKLPITTAPEKTGSTVGGFTDVPADEYYADAVLWAVEKGITNGVGGELFAPNEACTRGQMVTFLYRAAGSPAVENVSVNFEDVTAGAYYIDAIEWAVEKGITNGMGDGLFAPKAVCTRGQMATFLSRMVGGSASGKSGFSDVNAGAYYAEAVAWAVENGITNGMSDGIFAPNAKCTRGQMVTFLYRCFAK